jgi:asparagine synthetase B (glutamine-hydrolysing)
VVPSFRVIGRTGPCFGWDGSSVVQALPGDDDLRGDARPVVEGAFAGVGRSGDRTWLARDPLGLGKLFWAASNGDIDVASHPARLVERGHALDDCTALPANVVVTYEDGAGSPTVRPMVDPVGGEPDVTESVEGLAARIRATVDGYVGGLLAARPGPVIVCLSGGLDSTSVAALARAQRDDVVAITFDLARPGSRRRSEDFLAAHDAARHLGLDVVPAIHSPERLFELLDTVLVAGIDWRDFNVSIAELVGSPAEATILTGDLVNELLADYHSETYEGRTYYRLPRLPIAATRAALVRGLATSHREIGVFGAFGLPVVQPYAAARDAFLRLPDDVLGPGPGKARLYRAMFGGDLPDASYERPKTRAQTGSAVGERGVLAACADAGFDERRFARRFAELHGVDDIGALTRFLRAGRYRSGVPLK